MESLLLGCRLFLGLVFLNASLPKLHAPAEFERALGNYQLLPTSLVQLTARWLARFELMIAVALLTGIAAPITAAVAGTALLLFAVAIVRNLARGRGIDCGCFGGVAPRRITWRLAVSDALLASVAFVLAADPPATWAAVTWPYTSERSASVSDGLAILIVVSSAIMLKQLFTERARLVRFVSLAGVERGRAGRG